VRSFRGLLDHLATLTRATVAIGGATFDKISDPTPAQRRAFELIQTPIPLTITPKQTGPPRPARQNHSPAPTALPQVTKLRARERARNSVGPGG
jgi:hypothetical protein